MMKFNGFLLIALFSILGFACQNNDKNNANSELDERQVLLDSITENEKALHADLELDVTKADDMIQLYLQFANAYEGDSLAPEYLFRAAEIAMNAGKPVDACSYLYRVESQYEDYANMPAVYLMLGFVHENMNGDKQNAEKYYQEFVNRYPDHERAEEVQHIIDNLHMSDLELIRQFEKQNQEI